MADHTTGMVSNLLSGVPFPFGENAQRDKALFGDRRPGFRFESLATEFENKDQMDNDNDSGIDSEDVSTVSPGSSICSPVMSSPEQREPLSLVVRDMNKPREPAAQRTPKHWKKSISRSYDSENQENGRTSPLVSTAQALLSLGRSLPAPPVPTSSSSRLLPIPVAPSRPVSQPRIVQPWATPAQEHQPLRSSHTAVRLAVRQDLCSPPTAHPAVSSLVRVKVEPMPQSAQVTSSSTTAPQVSPRQFFPQLPQTPAPLKEVQSNLNLQLPSRPPLSVTNLAVKREWRTSPPCSPPGLPMFNENVKEELRPAPTAGQEKPFHCAECRKSFSTQSGYAKHQQLHCANQIQRDFSCKFCNKAYTSLSALKMHIRTHTLPCKCPECGKSFSRPWLLQGHMRTHTGEKPFGCTHCARSFADKSNLRAHLQTHLQNKKYSCPGCQKTFSRMSLLNKHTDSGCLGLQSRNEEAVETLMGLSSGLLRS